MKEMVNMGYGSLPIIFLISTFIGAVTTVQTSYQLVSNLIPKSTIGSVVSASAILEMAPTIIAIVLAGVIGSKIASEIGTQRVTDQIDALEVFGINSAAYLILPKIISAIFIFPTLSIIACFLMHVGGIIAGELTHTLTFEEFTTGTTQYFDVFQIKFMLIKAFTYGFLVSSISAYNGYFVSGGSLEVGKASTQGVVFSCIFVVLFDYILAQLML